MTQKAIALLTAEMDDACESLNHHLAGLTTEEFLWEPVPGCWTVHCGQNGHWVVDYAEPAPDPPPLTTIAWRLLHLAECKVMYHEYAFGERRLTWEQLPVPHTVAQAVGWLKESHARLRGALKISMTRTWKYCGSRIGATRGRPGRFSRPWYRTISSMEQRSAACAICIGCCTTPGYRPMSVCSKSGNNILDRMAPLAE